MFEGCINIEKAPDLPASILVGNCYAGMFYGCKKLSYVKALFVTQPGILYTNNWLYDVAASGTFIKGKYAFWKLNGSNGIPNGWTVQDNYQPLSYYNLQITADDVSYKETNTTIYWTCMSDGVELGITNTPMIGIQLSGTSISNEFPQNTSETNTVERVITFEYQGLTATTTITQGVWKAYTIDLNSNWEQSTSISNPDSSLYDGVYQSYSNKGVNNSAAKMYIDINGYNNFYLYIRSYAESNYDYVMVSHLDTDIDGYSLEDESSLIKSHTRGNQQSGNAISNYKLVKFNNIDGGEHRITIVYRKDGSAEDGDDRGYVLIPTDQDAMHNEFGNSNIIHFSIYHDDYGETYTYQADKGMTWLDWCNSEYNTDGWWCDENGEEGVYNDNLACWISNVYYDTTITEDKTYSTQLW
jgi:hypothetical protein